MKVIAKNGKFYLTGRKADVEAVLKKESQSAFRGTPGQLREEFESDQDKWGNPVRIPRSWAVELVDPEGNEPTLHLSDGGQSFAARIEPQQARDILESIRATNPRHIPKLPS